jgi:pilus assembly protein Flp/PilA
LLAGQGFRALASEFMVETQAGDVSMRKVMNLIRIKSDEWGASLIENKVVKLLNRLKSEESGASLIEYTVLLAILLVAVIAVIVFVGGWIFSQWAALSNALP